MTLCVFQGGPRGCLMTFDGEPTDPTEWKCQNVNGEPGNNDEKFGVHYDDSTWGNGMVNSFMVCFGRSKY